MKTEIIAVRYREGAFVPLSPSAVSKKYKENELYFFRPDRKRNWPGHQAFMAFINEAFETLPDNLQEEYQSPEILRRRMLIAAGYAKVDSIVFPNDDAVLSAAIKMREYADDHTFMSIRGNVLVIAKAHSQRMDAMDTDTFKTSCQKVTEQLERLLGCSASDIKAHAQSLKG